MIKLEEKFVSGAGGYAAEPRTYTQIARTETFAIYERSVNGVPKDYEVFEIKILPKGTQIFTTFTEDDQEKYPSNSQFGMSAWSCLTKERAMQRYDELVAKGIVNKADEATPKKELIIPVNQFTTNDVVELNSVNYITAANFIKKSLGENKIKFIEERRLHSRGKASKFYSKI
jgi:hypothetical protein